MIRPHERRHRLAVLDRERWRAEVEGGMSQRAAAKMLGVHHSTVQADLADKSPSGGGKSATGSAATKARRAKNAPPSFATAITADAFNAARSPRRIARGG